MNIFALDQDPVKAAKYHCDKHVNKMILETAQLMSTCLKSNGISDPILYKQFNPKHPSNLWVAESRSNFEWLGALGIALCDQKIIRTGKSHNSILVINKALELGKALKDNGPTKFKMAMPQQFMTEDPVHSYRLYYAGSKFRFATWSTEVPDWWETYRKLVIEKRLEVDNDKNDGVTL